LAPRKATTQVKGITINVGKTGALTPTAQLEPVELAGVTVSNVSLHNEDEVRRKDVRVGDTVAVAKRDGSLETRKVTKLYTFDGLHRRPRLVRTLREPYIVGSVVGQADDPAVIGRGTVRVAQPETVEDEDTGARPPRPVQIMSGTPPAVQVTGSTPAIRS